MKNENVMHDYQTALMFSSILQLLLRYMIIWSVLQLLLRYDYLKCFKCWTSRWSNHRIHLIAGFTENTSRACCGGGGTYNYNLSALCGLPGASACANPAKSINWDGRHTTEAANQWIAKALLNGIYTIPHISTSCVSQQWFGLQIYFAIHITQEIILCHLVMSLSRLKSHQ